MVRVFDPDREAMSLMLALVEYMWFMTRLGYNANHIEC